MPVDVGVAVEDVGGLVDAIAAGTSGGVLRMLPTLYGGWEPFAKAENAFEFLPGRDKGSQGKLEALETEDGTAVAFDDGILAVPVGAAEVAADNEGVVFDALHWSKDTSGEHGRQAVAHRTPEDRQSAKKEAAAGELSVRRQPLK